MKERPVSFDGGMVRAILAGRKTQARSVIKPQPPATCLYERNGEVYIGMILRDQPSVWGDKSYWRYGAEWGARPDMTQPFPTCPYGSPGDRLWVRETWGAVWPDIDREYALEECKIEYRADLPPDRTDYPGGWPADEARGNPDAPKWRPSIHMPRWASRITLEVTGVRIERMQDISKHDAIAEGIQWSEAFPEGYVHPGSRRGFGSAQQAFRSLWDSINAKRGYSWDSNPWVWVVEFEVIGND